MAKAIGRKTKSKKTSFQRRAEFERKIEARERAFLENIAGDFQRLKETISVMANALEAQDMVLAGLRRVLCIKGHITEEDLDQGIEAIIELRERARKKIEAKRELFSTQAARMKAEGVPDAEISAILQEADEKNVEPEQVRMRRAAEGVSLEDSIPTDAFIF